MKENTRIRVNHEFLLIGELGGERFDKPYGFVKSIDEYGIKVKLDLCEEIMYFDEVDLEII